MFSQTVEYALRAVYYIGLTPDTPSKTVDIAEQMQIPPAYLAKVMQKLARGGVVKSLRGKNGGYVLATSADKLNLLTLVNSVDPFRRSEEQPLGPNHKYHLNPLHIKLNSAVNLVENAFFTTTLADLTPDNN